MSTTHPVLRCVASAAAAALIAFALPMAASQAQATYKCVHAGKITYTDKPCEDPSAPRVERPALDADARQQKEARERATLEVQRADKLVEQARKRNDADAKRRAEVVIAERRVEEARLKKEAAQEARKKQQDNKMQRASSPAGFTAKAPQ
jgi:hypothetical protein